MTFGRTMARVAGALFLVAMLTYAAGDAMVAPLLPVPGDTGNTVEQPVQAWYGLLLMFLNSLAVAAIPVLLFPTLRRHSSRVASIYLAARWLESVLLLVGILVLAWLLSGAETHPASAVAQALVAAEVCYQLAMFALGVGSVALCRLLLRERLLPAWLAWWGLAGYGLLAGGAVFALAGWDESLLLSVPGGVFELVFGLWLMTKGFALHPDRTTRDRRVSA